MKEKKHPTKTTKEFPKMFYVKATFRLFVMAVVVGFVGYFIHGIGLNLFTGFIGVTGAITLALFGKDTWDCIAVKFRKPTKKEKLHLLSNKLLGDYGQKQRLTK